MARISGAALRTSIDCLVTHDSIALLPKITAPTVCIVGEPTGMRVIAAHKSINVFELTVHGVAAHSSLTPQGVNAIEYAALSEAGAPLWMSAGKICRSGGAVNDKGTEWS